MFFFCLVPVHSQRTSVCSEPPYSLDAWEAVEAGTILLRLCQGWKELSGRCAPFLAHLAFAWQWRPLLCWVRIQVILSTSSAVLALALFRPPRLGSSRLPHLGTALCADKHFLGTTALQEIPTKDIAPAGLLGDDPAERFLWRKRGSNSFGL